MIFKERLIWLWRRILRHGRSHLNTEKEALHRLIDRIMQDIKLEMKEHKNNIGITEVQVDAMFSFIKDIPHKKLDEYLSGESHSNLRENLF